MEFEVSQLSSKLNNHTISIWHSVKVLKRRENIAYIEEIVCFKSSLFQKTKNSFRLIKITHINLLILNLCARNFCRQVQPRKVDKFGWCDDYKQPTITTSLAFLLQILMQGLILYTFLNQMRVVKNIRPKDDRITSH